MSYGIARINLTVTKIWEEYYRLQTLPEEWKLSNLGVSLSGDSRSEMIPQSVAPDVTVPKHPVVCPVLYHSPLSSMGTSFRIPWVNLANLWCQLQPKSHSDPTG